MRIDITAKKNFKAEQFAHTLSMDIVEATESSPALRAEMRKVFHKANRRIQNLKSSAPYSPALQALQKSGVTVKDTFSTFGMKGNDWESLKMQYGKAIAFLNNPYSTATNSRSYVQEIARETGKNEQWVEAALTAIKDKRAYNGSDDQFIELIQKYVVGNYSSSSDPIETSINETAETEARILQDMIDAQAFAMGEQVGQILESSFPDFTKSIYF